MSNPVVSDKMRYGLKPIAVESKSHILTVPCIGTNTYSGDTGSTIVFRIMHNPGGRYIDPTATEIKMTFSLNLPSTISVSDSFLFERGPESIIRRFQIKDIQGRVLEDIDQYNMVYAVTELCTNDPTVRQSRGAFHMESSMGDTDADATERWSFLSGPDAGGWIKHPKYGYQNGLTTPTIGTQQVVTFDVTFTPLSAVFGGACEKYVPLSVMEGLEIHLQLENIRNCIKYQFTPYPIITTAALKAGATGLSDFSNFLANTTTKLLDQSGFWASHYVTDANGVLALPYAQTFSPNTMWMNHTVGGLAGVGLNDATQSLITYTIKDPKLLLSCLDVEPSVNAALINAAKDPRDGMIRIQTFSWMTLATQIQGSFLGTYSWVIPISVTSLKSIFFTLTNMSTLNNMNYMKTGFEHRGIQSYEFRVGGLPINADAVVVDNNISGTVQSYSQPIDALMEAWSVHHKTEGNPTLITRDNYAPAYWDPTTGFYVRERDVVFGQELESFSQKSGIIQSGINTMQTTFELRATFGNYQQSMVVMPALNIAVAAQGAGTPAVARAVVATTENYTRFNLTDQYELRAYCMYDKVIAFDETSGSIRSEY